MGLSGLVLTIGLLAALLGVFFGLLWLAARFIHPTLAAVLGIAAVAFTVYSILDGFIGCNSPPVYVPPQPGEPGDGAMIFACDGPGGAAAYLGLILAFPFMACLALITHRVWHSARKRQG